MFIKNLNYTYHNRDWLTDINDVTSTTEPFAAEYNYFDDGNIKTAKFYNTFLGSPFVHKFKYEYTYDKRKQLTQADYFENESVSSDYDVKEITYDDNGNLLTLYRYGSQGTVMDSLTYEYGTDNRLQTLEENVSSTTNDYSYDNNGNVVSIEEDGNDKFRTIHYEYRNLPVFVELGDFTDIIYLYNADGQRIFKKVAANTGERYIMDGSQNVGLLTETGSLAYWNMAASGTVGRLKANGDKLFYIKDHLGSTRAVVNESGAVVESHDYYPFGLLMPGRSFGSNGSTKELFTGKEFDAETGLFHIVWRRYDPVIGRWLSVDPITNQVLGWSPYNYTLNNPVNWIDPTGLQTEDDEIPDEIREFLSQFFDFEKIVNKIKVTIFESAKETPEFSGELASETIRELETALERAPEYGIRTLEVTATVADIAADATNVVALGALTVGQPEIALPAFAFGRGLEGYSLGAKFTLAAIDRQRYGATFGRQLGANILGAGGGRLFNIGYNAGANRFVNKQSGKFFTNFQGYVRSYGTAIINLGGSVIK